MHGMLSGAALVAVFGAVTLLAVLAAARLLSATREESSSPAPADPADPAGRHPGTGRGEDASHEPAAEPELEEAPGA
ncbi:MAG TPA: hypothetical protein VG253_22685 [Streptosporangiaceae bacterium]|jgi:hypothetical protein|nr:hypothetical protein [Streptosporangiaceae bacterium]